MQAVRKEARREGREHGSGEEDGLYISFTPDALEGKKYELYVR
jgi:hypothetical protein